jgi:parallel beta-helix repeat protein
MSENHFLFVLILSMLVMFPVSSAQYVLCFVDGNKNDFEVQDLVAYLPVPFHYQVKDYYCGPAALEMIFDYYGEDISQVEIADVARTYADTTYSDELRRAAHFSNLSTSLGDEMVENITGYSTRKFGYAAFEQSGLAIDDLKNSIDGGEPLIVLMWWTSAKIYGHYRVVVGYNDTHIIMHDPWNRDLWGGAVGGANISMTYSTFLDLWEYSDNWGLLVHPWKIELRMPSTVRKRDNFEVTANMTYPCSSTFLQSQYPAYHCNATIQLPEGLQLALGETPQHSIGNVTSGGSVQTSWTVNVYEAGFYNVSVAAEGIIEGSVGSHGPYSSYNYQDVIGGLSVSPLLQVYQADRVHNMNTGLNYTFIQEAIDDPETQDGHTIFAEAGTYYEHVIVNKTLLLVGADKETTVIDGKGTGVVVSIFANNVTVTGFSITNGNSGYWPASNILVQGNFTTIKGNKITDNPAYCILVDNSYANNIVDNIVADNGIGVQLWRSIYWEQIYGNNVISNNTIANNSDSGVYLLLSENNVIKGNTIINNGVGVKLSGSIHNQINLNTIQNNDFGIILEQGGGSGNMIYNNNFVNNTKQADVESEYCYWNFEYPWGGNYWSDYNDTDSYRGPHQNATGSDGMGDNPRVIDPNNADSYPLMGMIHSYNASYVEQGLVVTLVSNSTVSNFNAVVPIANPEEKQIWIDVTGENDFGFCRLSIPHALINVSIIRVIIDEGLTPVLNPNFALYDDGTYRWIYFAYEHTNHRIVIIPEFLQLIILPLFMMVTLSVATVKRMLKH